MEVFALSFLVILLAMAGLGFGRFFGRRAILGSCGGANGGAHFGRCAACKESPGRDPAVATHDIDRMSSPRRCHESADVELPGERS